MQNDAGSPEGMGRKDVVLAVLSTSGGTEWTPVQVQKMFFLLDKKIPSAMGGPHFQFHPYDYGPFDSDVYAEIEGLATLGLAHVARPSFGGMRTFMLTPEGQQRGQGALHRFQGDVADYVSRLSVWVRSLSFQQLVSAVYAEFPEMRVNSVFRG